MSDILHLMKMRVWTKWKKAQNAKIFLFGTWQKNMKIALITGSGGLVGGESVEFFANKFDKIIGIDNDLRQYFFGKEASTQWNNKRLYEKYKNFTEYNVDIRNTPVYRETHNELYKVMEKVAQGKQKLLKLKNSVSLLI